MAYSLIAHVSAGSSGGGDVTTAAIDTTGANLIIVHVARYDPVGIETTYRVDDNKSNTYTDRTEHKTSVVASRISDVLSPTVGSGHTFTVTGISGGNSFPTINVLAFSGATTGYDIDTGATATSASTLNTGSLAAAENDMLFVTGLVFGDNSAGAVSVDSSFNIQDSVAYSAGNHLGGSIAYLIQTSAGTVNPQWNVANTTADLAASIADYKDTPSGGGGGGWGTLLASGRNRMILQG